MPRYYVYGYLDRTRYVSVKWIWADNEDVIRAWLALQDRGNLNPVKSLDQTRVQEGDLDFRTNEDA